MPLPWIKTWLEGLDDPKLTRLSLAERGAWWGILQLAGKCDAGGKILSGSVGLDMDEIADALHVKTSDDRQALESMVAKMEKRGSLKWNENNILTVIHWEERQRIPPSARPEAIADRVRRYRDRRKETGKGNEVQQLPEAGEDEEVPLVTKEPARDSEEATGTLKKAGEPRDSEEATGILKAGDEEVLAVWLGVKDFPRDSNEATRFLNKLRAEFPDVDILEESKSWAAAKLSMPLTKRSMPFKQLRAWMMKARQFQEERQESYREKKGEDKDKYIKGKYGHMVQR